MALSWCDIHIIFCPSKISILPARASYKWSYLRRNSFSLNITAFLCVCVSIINGRASCFVVGIIFCARRVRRTLWFWCMQAREQNRKRKTIQEHVSLNSDTRIDLSVNIKYISQRTTCALFGLRALPLCFCVFEWDGVNAQADERREMRNRTSIYLCKHKHPPGAARRPQ